MKYMLMMHAPRGTGDYAIFNWTPDALQAHVAHMHDINRDLNAADEMVSVQGLTPPGQARLVRAGEGGPVVTDGPFAEAKEFLAGFWVVDVETPERAYEIAARASAAPGPDGAPLNLSIEVRQVMSAPVQDA